MRFWRNGKLRTARARAKNHLKVCNPEWQVFEARLRAEEPGRAVFAVFYEDPEVPVTPARYRLLAVPLDGGEIEALETTPESPYWIHGRK